jgi:hypothetical protein
MMYQKVILGACEVKRQKSWSSLIRIFQQLAAQHENLVVMRIPSFFFLFSFDICTCFSLFVDWHLATLHWELTQKLAMLPLEK